jgi:hypothetical protein
MAAIFYKCLTVYSWWLVSLTSTKPVPPQSFARHPFYIAVTEITLNSSDKILEVTCKIFANDLGQSIGQNNHAQLDIFADKDKANFDKYIPVYIKNHLSLSVDGKAASLSYISFENEKEFANCYFQVENISSLKKIDITDSILYDFTPGQINIIHVTVNGKTQSAKLNYPDKNASFSF